MQDGTRRCVTGVPSKGGWRHEKSVKFRPEIFYSSKIFYGSVDFFGILHLCTVIFKWVFRKCVPQIIQFNRDFHYKSSIRGTPIFGNTQMSRTTNEHVQNARKTRRTGTEFWNCFGCVFFSMSKFFKRRKPEKKRGWKFSSKKKHWNLISLCQISESYWVWCNPWWASPLWWSRKSRNKRMPKASGGTVVDLWSCFLRLNWNPTHLISD